MNRQSTSTMATLPPQSYLIAGEPGGEEGRREEEMVLDDFESILDGQVQEGPGANLVAPVTPVYPLESTVAMSNGTGGESSLGGVNGAISLEVSESIPAVSIVDEEVERAEIIERVLKRAEVAKVRLHHLPLK